jgi:hypothetical protein
MGGRFVLHLLSKQCSLILSNQASTPLPITTGPPTRSSVVLSDAVRLALYSWYQQSGRSIFWPTDRNAPPDATFLRSEAQPYKYLLVDGRRIVPVRHSQSSSRQSESAIVKTVVEGEVMYGEVLDVFRHAQYPSSEPGLFAEMRWLKKLPIAPVEDDPWND